MKIEDHVCSFEQAKKLKELGVKEPALFYWSIDKTTKEKALKHQLTMSPQVQNVTGKYFDRYSAYTVAELGVLLPDYIVKTEKTYECILRWSDEIYHIMRFKSEMLAHAMADALIWLIENKYIDVEDFVL